MKSLSFLLLSLFGGGCLLNAAPVPLFDGKSLDGWEGDKKLWRVENGIITGGSLEQKIPRNEFLATTKRFHNFDLRLKIKLTGTEGFVNSGVQIRSIRVPNNSEMSGYQVDAGEGWWGKLYDESRRNKVIAESRDAAAVDKAVRRNDWNEYRIRCEGPRIQTWINGVAALDYTETDPKIAQDGLIGIQVHGGGITLVQVKEIMIEELPATPGAPRWPDGPQTSGAQKAGDAAARTAMDERAAFQLPPGFVAELVADESVMRKAVAFNFDDVGRMWVTTAGDYPLDANEQPAQAAALYDAGGHDNVLIFDTPWASGLQKPRVWAGIDPSRTANVGARATPPEGASANSDVRRATFALAMPMGVLPYKDGAIVQHGTDLIFLRDTDGDGVADTKERLLTGFGIQDSHLMPHGFTRGPGDWIYFAQGAFNTSLVKTKEGPIVEAKHCKLMRMKPDGSHFEVVGWGLNNIWGFVIDPRGEMWVQEANDLGYPVAPFQPGICFPGIGDDKPKPYAPFMPAPKKQNDCTMGGTGLSGLALNEDPASWPPPWTGAFMVANPITNRIQAIRVHREAPGYEGVSLEKLPDFLVSTDDHFRPVSIQFGPDGALYVIDWYNKIISHNEVPRTHPERDKVRTRIWRIRAEAAPRREIPNLTKIAWDELGKHFASRNQWEANAARFEWIDRGQTELLDPMRGGLVEKLLSKASPPELRLQWLWALEAASRLGVGETKGGRKTIWGTDVDVLTSLLHDPDRAIRRESIRAMSAVDFPQRDAVAYYALLCTDDRDVDVRLAAIQTLARSYRAQAYTALLQFASRLPPPTTSTASQRFERALIRQSLESRRIELTAFLDSKETTISVEGRALAYLALDPWDAATRFARLIPELKRPLATEEIGLLVSNRSQPNVGPALAALLEDPKQQIGLLTALATIDRNLIPGGDDASKLHEQIAVAARKLTTRDSTEGNRALVVKLARNLKIIELEPEVVAYLESPGRTPAEQIEAVKALREMGSSRVALFRDVALRAKDELRREAVLGIASAKSPEVVTALVTLWPQLGPPLRKLTLDRLTSSPQHAPALIAAARDGFIPPDDFDAAILDRLAAHLGENDPALRQVISEMKNAVQPVLRLHGKPGDIAETKIDLLGPFTVEAWIRLEPGIDNNDNLLGQKGGADINFYDAKLRVYGGADVRDVVIAKTSMKPLTWTHVAVARESSGRIHLYINGELDATSADALARPLTGLNIGETNPGGGCAAEYTEFRIWDVARSPEEIRDQYQLRISDEGGLAKTGDALALPAHLVRYMSGTRGWGILQGTARIDTTRDYPELLTRGQTEARAKKFATYRTLANAGGGGVDKGRDLFAGLCMTCHAVNGNGGNIGPNLSGAGAMGVEALLRNILTPNAQLESGYYRYDAELKNGEIVSGFLAAQESEAVVIRQIGAQDRKIARGELKKLVITKKSLMPEGLLEGLPQESVRDLFAYLRTLK
jgi:putative heme-binding domain-containing protein